jgi:anti-sigma regulatory factor (Ser/Thr protein kinase)
MQGREGSASRPAAAGDARPGGRGPAAMPVSGDDPAASGVGVRVPPFMTQPGHGAQGGWPLQDFLELGALASAVPCARLHARQVAWEWGLRHLAEGTGLIVTEFVTNALSACQVLAQPPPVRLWLVSDRARILIVVWDASPRPPVRAQASGEAEHGRGLMLVEAVSEQWGWYPRSDGRGKFLWAVL